MLKNYKFYQMQHKQIMKVFMCVITFLLLAGLSVSPISWEETPYRMMTQIILISGILFSLLNYIKRESGSYKTVFIILITLYFYMKFWTFPETAIMLSILALTPLFPIFLYDAFSFYVIASLNFILGPLIILFISNSGLQEVYTYVALDPLGNILNFTAIQIILVFVFIGMRNKMQSAKAFQMELQQAKQMNSIGQLAATIAHEIRNPITVVKGFAQLLEQDPEKNEKDAFYVQTMLSELDYAQVIINDYLSLAKPHNGEMHIISLPEEIRKISDLLTSFAKQHSIGIHTLLETDISIRMNKIEFKQLMINIIKNAIEAMKDTGFIVISLEEKHGMAVISVKDTGIGMSNAQLELLGTPFYSLKDRGTGIGLTVCYNIVDKYKGKILVDSNVGKGTIFSIHLPMPT